MATPSYNNHPAANPYPRINQQILVAYRAAANVRYAQQDLPCWIGGQGTVAYEQ